METISSNPKVGQAVVEVRSPDTAGFVPIVIGPGPTGRPKRDKDDTTPYTMSLVMYSGDTGYNGTVHIDLEFFGFYEDNSGNISLIDAPAQIPPTNGNGQGNQKQTVTINGQNHSPLSVLVTPNGNPTAILAIGRAQGGGSFGNVGAYIFDV